MILHKLKCIKSIYDNIRYIIYIHAKQTHNPFILSGTKTIIKLEKVHSDICDQYLESKSNSIYTLIFLDEFTHYIWTITIPDKSSEIIMKEFSNWIKEIERETSLKVKRLWIDDEGEYQDKLTPILKSLDIKHETTPSHTSQSNDKVERMNRTLNETVCAILFQVNMPESF